MLRTLLDRARQEEEGFTLIELMVVVLIIGILIAIALPTFLGARQRAEARAAQSSVRNALVAAKASYTDVDSYNNVTANNLLSIEPSLTYQAAASTGPTVVSFEIGLNGATTDQEIGLAGMANSGTCFFLRDDANIGGRTPPARTMGPPRRQRTARARTHATTPRPPAGKEPPQPERLGPLPGGGRVVLQLEAARHPGRSVPTRATAGEVRGRSPGRVTPEARGG